jgi:hypothetical protein
LLNEKAVLLPVAPKKNAATIRNLAATTHRLKNKKKALKPIRGWV